MIKFASLFSGGGVLECGLAPSVKAVLAVEYDPQIAEYYRRNHGDHIVTADVCAVDFTALGVSIDHLHASPVCTRASIANKERGETELDIATAQATIRALEALQPAAYTLENVYLYRTFKAFRMICAALDRLGYWWQFVHVSAADYGVPQDRRRLWLWARRDTMLSALPTPSAWRGWYDAIADLLPSLPDTQFAPWQLARLQQRGNRASCFVADCRNSSKVIDMTVCDASEPMFTITSTNHKGMPKASINNRVVQLSTRCLARLQAMPDSYVLPERRALACKIIGNGAPFGALVNHMWGL